MAEVRAVRRAKRVAKLVANHVVKRGEWADAWDLCTLTYDGRFLRRRKLETAHEEAFLVDLEQTVSVDHGDAFKLTNGRLIEVIAAEEDLLQVSGNDLVRLAWHIGNRHTPCQVETERLVIQRDPVIRKMLELLGAEVMEISEPFHPEGGAYGHGRTHGHDHSHEHEHSHGHSHEHAH